MYLPLVFPSEWEERVDPILCKKHCVCEGCEACGSGNIVPSSVAFCLLQHKAGGLLVHGVASPYFHEVALEGGLCTGAVGGVQEHQLVLC